MNTYPMMSERNVQGAAGYFWSQIESRISVERLSCVRSSGIQKRNNLKLFFLHSFIRAQAWVASTLSYNLGTLMGIADML